VKQDIFDQLLEFRISETRRLLSVKAKEYGKGESDRLYTFKEAAKLEGSNPADALRGMLIKHWVSIKDLVTAWVNLKAAQVNSPLRIDDSAFFCTVNEKIGDGVAYLVLLEAILKESL
jgi:hypothetical protein